MKKGKFVISLDFELHWGNPEKWDLNERKDCLNETRKSIPIVLDIFKKYEIHATWATVGILFAKNKSQLLKYLPSKKPTYINKQLNYYKLIEGAGVGENEEKDPYHFGYSLISKIIETPNQELATHTFTHYYCNEKGQNELQFDADLKAAQKIANDNFKIKLESLVLPRNQFNAKYITIAKQNGIKVVRSNPDVWFWKKLNKLTPFIRAIDSVFPVSNRLTYSFNNDKEILLLPASRFLRAFSMHEKYIHKLKLRRIKKEMLYAAKNSNVYHLWWHPHNFGYSLKENIIFLENILKEYQILNKKYDFQSSTMIEMYK